MNAETLRTCFVISPIGDDGSEVRKKADDLFDLVIEPALRAYNFQIIRADKILRSSVITSDIVHLVQSAHLCIIDLTGSNPNVFYECGRRHETGKPFIQLLQKGDTLPFDVAGIRTIPYDLSTPRTVYDSSEVIRKYVEEIVQSGFDKTSGESLSTIAATLERIERRLVKGTPLALAGPSGETFRQPRGMQSLRAIRNPREAFMQAVANGDIESATFLLSRLEQTLSDTTELAHAAAYLADSGVEAGADMLLKIYAAKSESLDVRALKAIASSLNDFFSVTDRESEGIDRLLPIIEFSAIKADKAEDKAFFANQKAKLLYGAHRFSEAVAVAKQVVVMFPNDPAYLYNLSLCDAKVGDTAGALKAIEQYMALDGIQVGGDHLAHAVEVFYDNEMKDRAKAALRRLKEKDPQRANLLLFRRDELQGLE